MTRGLRIDPLAKSYLLVLIAAGILYGISCAPGAVWQDSGLIQYRVWHHDIEGRLGLALSHPLYYLIAIGAGHVPLGEFGHRVNCVSALAGALAVANLYLLMRLWLGRVFPAVIAAATLALSHTFWWHASIAETYTLWAALFLGELVCLLQYTRTRKLGVSLSARARSMAWQSLSTCSASIPLACYAVFIVVLLARRTIRPRHAAIVALLWIVGALPYEYLIVKNIVQSGDVLGTSGLRGLRRPLAGRRAEHKPVLEDPQGEHPSDRIELSDAECVVVLRGLLWSVSNQAGGLPQSS